MSIGFYAHIFWTIVIKLEDELKELRAQQQGEEQGAQRRFPGGSDTLEELRRKFAEAEEKVSAQYLILINF